MNNRAFLEVTWLTCVLLLETWVFAQRHSLDLFQITDHEIRRSGQGVDWGWEKWCQLQPKKGNCTKMISVFYYDTQVDQCREFDYSGCNGNQNKFSSKDDCLQFCKGFGLIMEARAMTSAESCAMQPNPGTCLAYIPQYYFDVNTKTCKEFVFGGCGGNSNRFSNKQDCISECLESGA